MDHAEYAKLRAAIETAHDSGRFTFVLSLVAGLLMGWLYLCFAAVVDLAVCVVKVATWPFRVVYQFCDTTYCILVTYRRVSLEKSNAANPR